MERIKKIKYFIIGSALLPAYTFAAPLIDKDTGGPKASPSDVTKFIERVKNIILGVAGIIAIAMLIYGGFLYMTSGGNEERAQKAKTYLTYAIGGLLLVLLSYVIVYLLVKTVGGNIK